MQFQEPCFGYPAPATLVAAALPSPAEKHGTISESRASVAEATAFVKTDPDLVLRLFSSGPAFIKGNSLAGTRWRRSGPFPSRSSQPTGPFPPSPFSLTHKPVDSNTCCALLVTYVDSGVAVTLCHRVTDGLCPREGGLSSCSLA